MAKVDDDLDMFDDLDDFEDLAEFDEPAPDFDYKPVDLNAVDKTVKAEPKPKKGTSTRKVGAPRDPMWSGHCLFPQTAHPEESHARCEAQGAGNRAVPDKVFSPCPCRCHLDPEVFDCGNCGRPLHEAPRWTVDPEYPDDAVYVHVDSDGNAIGVEC